MGLDNVIPLWDMFEGNLYASWQRLLFWGFIAACVWMVAWLVVGIIRDRLKMKGKGK